MDDLQFSAATEADLEEAYNQSIDACLAIEELQQTDLWRDLPIESRRAICAARAHMGALIDALHPHA